MSEYRERADQLILTLVNAKDEAFRLRLFDTAQALDGAAKRLGWELAGRLERLAELKEVRGE